MYTEDITSDEFLDMTLRDIRGFLEDNNYEYAVMHTNSIDGTIKRLEVSLKTTE